MSVQFKQRVPEPEAVPSIWLRGLDVAALAALASAIVLTMAGGLRITLFDIRLSIFSPDRALLCAAALIVVRHALRARPSLASRVWDSAAMRSLRADLPLVASIMLTTRASAIAVGLLAVATIGLGPEARYQAFSNPWLNLPARWDAQWYTEIAAFGYRWDGDYTRQQSVVFFPAFPALSRLAARLLGLSTLHAAWVVAIVAFAGAVLLFVRLTRRRYGDDVAATAAWFLAVYPFAVYFSAPYSEALFLLAMCGAFLAAEGGKWHAVAAWGLLAGLTRPNGWLLAAPIALASLRHAWPVDLRGWLVRISAVAAPVIGVLLFTFYLHLLFNDGFAWLRGQAAWGRELRGLHLFALDRLTYISSRGVSAYLAEQPIDALNTIAAVAALGLVVPIARRVGVEYGALVAVLVLPPLLVGGSMSIGRMTSVLFPLFIWLALVVPARHRLAVLIACALLQGFCAALFFTWRPLF